jgi:lactate dehydrogenase-like 2-hydroxyacid dehydrogenase
MLPPYQFSLQYTAMGSKPKVVVTRKLPEAVEARLRRDYEPLFNTDDHVYSTDESIDLADGAGALLPCHSEHLDAAAGLDVFNGEPDIHPGYRELDNTFLLPHISSATRETRDAMGFRALDNLDAISAGREPADRVA